MKSIITIMCSFVIGCSSGSDDSNTIYVDSDTNAVDAAYPKYDVKFQDDAGSIYKAIWGENVPTLCASYDYSCNCLIENQSSCINSKALCIANISNTPGRLTVICKP